MEGREEEEVAIPTMSPQPDNDPEISLIDITHPHFTMKQMHHYVS